MNEDEEGSKRVDLSKLEEIEVGLSCLFLTFLTFLQFVLNSKDQKILEILISAQTRLDTNQLRGDEERTIKSKSIMGINWKRFKDKAMDPKKGQDSIIVSVFYLKCDQICLACIERIRKVSAQEIHGK